MKKYILIASILITALNLNAQQKLYFVEDIIPKYGKKTRIFRTDTIDFTTCEGVIIKDLIRINERDSLDAFYIQYYIRNNTSTPIKLTWFSTNAGSNVPKYDKKHEILKPSCIGCYTIHQGFFSLGTKCLSGDLVWEYIDKQDNKKKLKNIGLPYCYRIYE